MPPPPNAGVLLANLIDADNTAEDVAVWCGPKLAAIIRGRDVTVFPLDPAFDAGQRCGPGVLTHHGGGYRVVAVCERCGGAEQL